MTIKYSTIRPGLLVSLKTSITGNASYEKQEIENGTLADGTAVSRWETTRKIDNPFEYDLARKVRSRARGMIAGVCAQSSFGLLCSDDKAGELSLAIEAARAEVEQFNSGATRTKIAFNYICGRVVQDDVEAVRAINSDVRDMITAMQAGLEKLDVTAVRKAADAARGMAQMLAPDAQSRIKDAIDMARAAAKQIVKAGEATAIEIDKETINALTRVRANFLDMDVEGEVAAPTHEGRAVDFVPEETEVPPPVARPAAPAPQIEI